MSHGFSVSRNNAEQRQVPALLKVLRNSPRAMPLPANSGPASDDALGSRAIHHGAQRVSCRLSII